MSFNLINFRVSLYQSLIPYIQFCFLFCINLKCLFTVFFKDNLQMGPGLSLWKLWNLNFPNICNISFHFYFHYILHTLDILHVVCDHYIGPRDSVIGSKFPPQMSQVQILSSGHHIFALYIFHQTPKVSPYTANSSQVT